MAAETALTLDTINNTNLKTVAEAPAWSLAQKAMNDIQHTDRHSGYLDLAMKNTVDHQNRMNMLAESSVARFMERANTMDPSEAISTAKAFKGESDSAVLSLLSQISAGVVGQKTASIAVPETGLSSALAGLNAVNSSNYSNNTTNSSLAASMAAIASVLNKIAYNTPPTSA